MDEETMRLMRERGTHYVPTITAGQWVFDRSQEDGFFPQVVQPKAAMVGPQIQSTFAKAYRAGVKMMFGTDTGVSAHGDNGREFVLMVEAGMPAMEAIQSATIVPARFLDIEDRLGSVQRGKLADLIALTDISLMRQVNFVMKDGVVYRHP